MGSSEQMETLAVALGKRRLRENEEEEEEEEEEREIQELEREVKEMADKILKSRRKMPEQILEALSIQLVAQRRLIPQFGSELPSSSLSDRNAEAGTSGDPSAELQENAELREWASPGEADPVMLKKSQTFRDKTASNVAALPGILKRLNECIARLDRIDQYSVDSHLIFRRKRKSQPILILSCTRFQ